MHTQRVDTRVEGGGRRGRRGLRLFYLAFISFIYFHCEKLYGEEVRMMQRGCVYALQKEQVLLALVFVIPLPLPSPSPSLC